MHRSYTFKRGIPPKISISNFKGFERENTLMVYDRHPEVQSKLDKAFWAKGYYVETIGNITDKAVQDGEILINGKNIKKYNVKTLRQHVGIALQDSQAYAMSIRDNLTLYQRADDAELMEVCREYDLDHVLMKANASLDSQVTREFDEKGVLLSEGEKQRLALARLAIGDFGLLILDEPSSALDPLAEYEMNKIIFGNSSRTTTIMIPHKFSNVREADCIYVVDHGEIFESGTHNELMAVRGLYYEMFSKQSEKYTLEQ